ncbi:MAG: FixH family protein [Pseudomonadota bacterium]
MSEYAVNPWYREPWPWFIIGILGLGVFFGISILMIGLSNPPQMVRGEYERFGRGMVDVGSRTQQARELGLSAQISERNGEWMLDLSANDTVNLPDQLLLVVQHPVNAELDRTVLMERDTYGLYHGEWAEPPHHATLILQDLSQSWWISAHLGDTPESTMTLIPRRL